MRKTGNSEKEIHTEKKPTITGENKNKIVGTPKIEVTTGTGWYRFNYLNLKL